MSWLQEFKAFAMRGSVVDLAIGVIIGAAFGKVISSFVGDVLMPPLGFLIGGVDFSGLAITLKQATATTPAVAIKYGSFINALIDFVIVAFAIFAVIKLMNSFYKKETAAPTTKDCPQCLMPIPVNAKRCGHCTSTL